MLVIEVSKCDVDLDRLTACQKDATRGRYAAAMAGFVKSLAKRYGAVLGDLTHRRAQLRDNAVVDGQHARTPGIVADLAIGLHYFLEFAVELGAIDSTKRAELAERGWKALVAAAEQHADHLISAEPCSQFLRVLRAALASGRAHVADSAGNEPYNARAWGWRSVTVGAGLREEWQPLGKRIGWVSGEDLYLEPEAVYAESQKLATELGETLPISSRTLWRRMREKGLLSSWEQSRQRNTVRRSLEGVRHREVIHLRAETLSSSTQPSTPSTSNRRPFNSAENEDSLMDGAVDGQGRPSEAPSTETVHFSAGNSPGGRCGRSEEGISGSNRLFVLLPDGGTVVVPSLSVAPPNATSWCREGDTCWRAIDGQARK
jgi:hypothetical protein